MSVCLSVRMSTEHLKLFLFQLTTGRAGIQVGDEYILCTHLRNARKSPARADVHYGTEIVVYFTACVDEQMLYMR